MKSTLESELTPFMKRYEKGLFTLAWNGPTVRVDGWPSLDLRELTATKIALAAEAGTSYSPSFQFHRSSRINRQGAMEIKLDVTNPVMIQRAREQIEEAEKRAELIKSHGQISEL